MYAVFKTGGKQYRVKEKDTLCVERLNCKAGDKITFDKVLSLGEGENVKIGAPYVNGVKIEAEVMENLRGPKIIAFKMKRRKGYRHTVGHRQDLTKIKISKIDY